MKGAPQSTLKILHIIGSANPESGGPIEGILRQVECALPNEVRELVTLDRACDDFLKGFPLRVHPTASYSRGRSLNPFKRYGLNFQMIPWLSRHIGDYDVAVVNGVWNFASLAASLTLPSAATPYVVFTHGMLDPWFKAHSPRKWALKRALWPLVEGKLARSADAVLFTTCEERDLAVAQFPELAAKAIVSGYGTADPPPDDDGQQARAFANMLPALEGRPFLLFLSRIHPKKGCDDLIAAFADVASFRPDLQLVVAGPDEVNWKSTLQGLARERGVGERVHWPGMLRGDAKWGAFRTAQAFVLPSHSENFGIVVAESLACSCPVVITNKVNLWPDVQKENAGIVTNDNRLAFAEGLRTMLKMIEMDPQGVRDASRQAFENKFNIKAFNSTFREIILGIISRHSGPTH